MSQRYLYNISLFLVIGLLPRAYSLDESYLDIEEPKVTHHNDIALTKTKDALLSIEYIEKRADYFAFKIKKMTFGEHTEKLGYIAPLVTGKFEFSMYDVRFYYSHFGNKTGVLYQLSF